MKLRIWDRLISALTGLLAAAAGIGLILHLTGLLSFGVLQGRLQGISQHVLRAVGIASGVVLILLGVHGMGMLFRRRRDKGFVIQRTDLGDMSISMKALESMAKRCVSVYPDMVINSTRIYRVRDGINVELKVTLASGVNIPITVNALQKQIKQYITSCSGIDVHEVRVRVETDIAKLAAPAAVAAVEAPAAEPAAVAAAEAPVAEAAAEPAAGEPDAVLEEAAPAEEMQAEQEAVLEEAAAEEVVCEETAEAEADETADETIPEPEGEDAPEKEPEADFAFEPIQFEELENNESGEAKA